jgi:hypothetical protein
MRVALLSVLLAWLSLTACVAPVAVTPVTGEVSFADFSFSQSRDQVFDLALAVAQRLNLNVAVLEKSSGLLRFESAVLSADQLDNYCVYPYNRANTSQPVDTFAGWNRRSLANGRGPATGTVSLTVLLGETPHGTTVNLRAAFTAGNATEKYAVNSKQVLESAFRDALQKQIGGMTTAGSKGQERP